MSRSPTATPENVTRAIVKQAAASWSAVVCRFRGQPRPPRVLEAGILRRRRTFALRDVTRTKFSVNVRYYGDENHLQELVNL